MLYKGAFCIKYVFNYIYIGTHFIYPMPIIVQGWGGVRWMIFKNLKKDLWYFSLYKMWYTVVDTFLKF